MPVSDGAVFSGTLKIDVLLGEVYSLKLLGEVYSLKQKRALVKPVLADLNRRPGVGAAEVALQDLHRRAVLGVAVVAGTHQRVVELLDDCEGAVAWRPELEVLSVHRRIRSDEDD